MARADEGALFQLRFSLNMQVMQSGGCLEGLLSNAIQLFSNASILMAFCFSLLMSNVDYM